MDHPLLAHFLAAAEGVFPPVDGGVTVLPELRPGLGCSVAFTGHAFVATALAPAAVADAGPDGFGGSLAPDFLRFLAGPGGGVGTIDVILAAHGLGGPAALGLREDVEDHPRVGYARGLRDDVFVHGDERGFVTVASGLAGRRELSVELDDPGRVAGAGRALLRDALTLIPAGEPVFAAVAPGNARSLRAFLAAGFVPIGSEVVIRPAP
ncbi:MAG: hypothetical protein HOW97_01505 [Catenulispora sp.]|nr:hypothetical protein [Catenulispora sp.]